MKKSYTWAFFAVALMFLGTLQSFAVEYTISFTGSGISSTVGSVEAQNLTRNTKVTVPGGEVLVLNVTTTALNPLSAISDGMRIFSSLAEGSSSVSFYAKQAGNTQINVYSLDGRKIAGVTQNLQKGTNSFQIYLHTGAYVISVQGKGYAYSSKLVNVSSTKSRPEISFLGVQEKTHSSSIKSANASPTLDYIHGDIMLYKGISGNYATIVTDIPTETKVIDFDFIECKDASDNYYATVKIGNQIWMAENLRTTKYNNGTSIPTGYSNTDWANLSTGAYAIYSYTKIDGLNSDAEVLSAYGALYNYYAVVSSDNLCPTGWHVPSETDWTTLINYAGGESDAGSKLMSTRTSPDAQPCWETPSITFATDEYGFSALPGGARYPSGSYYSAGSYGEWWKSTEANEADAFGLELYYDSQSTSSYSFHKPTGLSVRCVKNN